MLREALDGRKLPMWFEAPKPAEASLNALTPEEEAELKQLRELRQASASSAASSSGGGSMTPRVLSGAEREAEEERARREEREAMEEYDRMMMGEAGGGQ